MLNWPLSTLNGRFHNSIFLTRKKLTEDPLGKVINFDYTVEAVGRLADKNHWHYEVWKRFLKKKNIEAIPKDIPFVPTYLTETLYHCNTCGVPSKMDWNSQLRGVILPIICKDGSVLQPVGMSLDCAQCGNPVEIEPPMRKWEGDRYNGQIYLDEAARDEAGTYLYTYSAISEPPRVVDKSKFVERFMELKAKLVPSISPNNWVVHLKDLCDARKRSKNQYFRHITQTQLSNFIRDVGQLVCEYHEKNMCIWNTSVMLKNPNQKSRQWAKEAAFYLIVAQPIVQSCKNGFSPVFNFERTQKDGWATNLFLKLQGTGAWTHMTQGIPVGLPKFVEPKPCPYLEIADMVSFVVARYLIREYRLSNGENIKIDFDPQYFGYIRYTGFVSDGGVDYAERNCFPEEMKTCLDIDK